MGPGDPLSCPKIERRVLKMQLSWFELHKSSMEMRPNGWRVF